MAKKHQYKAGFKQVSASPHKLEQRKDLRALLSYGHGHQGRTAEIRSPETLPLFISKGPQPNFLLRIHCLF